MDLGLRARPWYDRSIPFLPDRPAETSLKKQAMSLIDESAPSRAPPTHTLDCRMLARAADNDREACRVLLRHVRKVITVIMGMRSPHLDDAVQVAFMHVHKVADRFDPSRGQNAGPWVTRVALREAAAFFRQLPSQQSFNETDPEQSSHQQGRDPTEQIDRDRLMDRVHSRMSSLNQLHRQVLVAKYWADLDDNEIAAELDIPLNTVKSRLDRAKRILRQQLRYRWSSPRSQCDGGGET